MSELILSSPMPKPISSTYDLRDPSAGTLIVDALGQIATPGDNVIRVIGNPAQEAGLRACKRCHPDDVAPDEAAVAKAARMLEAGPATLDEPSGSGTDSADRGS